MRPDAAWILKPLEHMSAAEFGNWCQLLEERSGIVISQEKRTFLEVKLTARMRELGVTGYSSYYQKVLQGPSGAIEWAALLDHLTVQETCFFRHQPSFDFTLEFLRERLIERTDRRPLALWSVGCASGEEPWSLAMTAAEALRLEVSPLDFAVTATDISQAAIKVARRGHYSARRVQPVPETLRERYFTSSDSGGYQVVPALLQQACFAKLNVLELGQAPMYGMDVIFCHNLLIYFRRWQRREILNHLAKRLAPGGVLIIGVGEITGWQFPGLEPAANEQVLAFIRKG